MKNTSAENKELTAHVQKSSDFLENSNTSKNNKKESVHKNKPNKS